MGKKKHYVELYDEQTQRELEEKCKGIVFDNKRLCFIEDLSERDYVLESATPCWLDINGHKVESTSWVELLPKSVELLLSLCPKTAEELLEFNCEWTKVSIFVMEERVNYMPVRGAAMSDGPVYLDCNHTALHSCWLIQDLLDFFGVDKSSAVMMIRRPAGAMPKAVRTCLEKNFKDKFSRYLVNELGKSQIGADAIIREIDSLTPILGKLGKSHTSFYLFEDTNNRGNYFRRVRNTIMADWSLDAQDRAFKLQCLDELQTFYKALR